MGDYIGIYQGFIGVVEDYIHGLYTYRITQ